MARTTQNGRAGKSIFQTAEQRTAIVYIPAMVFAEILYLSEKRRITTSLDTVSEYLRQQPNCKEHPMNFAVMQAAAQITDIPELHDRLIAGTARSLGLELITDDLVIQSSTFVQTVW